MHFSTSTALACILMAGTSFLSSNASTDLEPTHGQSSVQTTTMSESRNLLQVGYTEINTLDVGTSNDCGRQLRIVQISDTKRLAATICTTNQHDREVEVYEFDASTSQYIDAPIFKTQDCMANHAFGFSGDGKTIVCPTSHCDGKIFNENSDGQWTSTDVNFFPCDGTFSNGNYYLPGIFQLGTSYDGTKFAVGGGAMTSPDNDPIKGNHGIVRVFEKNPDEGAWRKTYEKIGTYAKGFLGYTAVLSNDGKKLVFNDITSAGQNRQILKYVEQQEDGSWTEPIELTSADDGGGSVKASFTPDDSRLAVSNAGKGIYVFDYNGAGGWNQVELFSDYKYTYSDGSGMIDISDDGKRIIFCGIFLPNTVATFDQQEDNTWSESVWGDLKSYGGCTIDGSGGLLVASTTDGYLKAYRDYSTDLVLPTDAPTQSPTTAAVKAANEYQISFIDNSFDVAFDNNRLESEIKMSLNVTTRNVPELAEDIKIYDYDTCKTTEYSRSMLSAVTTKNASVPDPTSDGLFSAVPLVVDLNTTDISSFNNSTLYPGFFNTQEDQSVVLKFCLKPTIGLIKIYNKNNDTDAPDYYDTFVSYTKIKVQITVDTNMNFDTVAVAIEEDAPSMADEDVKMDYTLDAYECDAGTHLRIDNPPAISQNSLVTICIESTFDDIIVGDIKDLTLSQSSSGVTIEAIKNSEAKNSFTAVSSIGTKKAVVSTLLISAFFLDPSTIVISGVVTLEFGSGMRRLVRIGSSAKKATDRFLEVEEQNELGEFALSLDISDGYHGDAESAAFQTKTSFVIALFSAVVGAWLM